MEFELLLLHDSDSDSDSEVEFEKERVGVTENENLRLGMGNEQCTQTGFWSLRKRSEGLLKEEEEEQRECSSICGRVISAIDRFLCFCFSNNTDKIWSHSILQILNHVLLYFTNTELRCPMSSWD